MNINIDDIKVSDRIRIENGNVSELAKSIMDHGLINPITVMESPDGYLLIAGYRRLRAVKMLGLTKIDASVLPPCDAEEQLRIEIEENEARKDFTLSERVHYAEMLREIEEAKGRLRMGGHATGESGRARDIIAKKVGFNSGRQLDRAFYVSRNRPDLMEQAELGKISLSAAYECARGISCKKSNAPVKQPMISYEEMLDNIEVACADLIFAVVEASVEYGHAMRSDPRSESVFATIKKTCDHALYIFSEGIGKVD